MTPAELQEQIMVVPFVEMEPHLKRGAVIVVSEGLELVQVGQWLAEDNTVEIEKLIANGSLTKASPADFESWRRDKRFFQILIIQPFVLAQNFTALAPQGN